MGLKCRISSKDGVTQVVDDKGNESQLYNELLAYTDSETEALNLWTVASSEEFMGAGENATVKDVVAYMDSTEAATRSLSISEEFQVIDFMRRTGETSLNELNIKLAKIFKSDGTFKIDIKAAVNSGIFSQQEIEDLDVNKMQDILLKIEGQLITKDIVIEPSSQDHNYVDNDNKSVFGTAQKVTQKEFDNDIIRAVTSFTDKEAFLKGIKTLPYTAFVEKFQEDEAYAKSIMEKFKGLKKITKLSVVGRELSDENNELYTTIRNTILVNDKDVSVEAEIDYLNRIPQEIWSENSEDIKEVLKEVEQTLADINIDVVGLAFNAKNRNRVMDLLYSADKLLKNVNEENLQVFVEAHNNITETPSTIIAEKLDDRYVGLNIVSFHTERGADYIFKNYGLIEVGENLYHKVDQNAQIDTLKDFIYDQFIDGAIDIPAKFITTKNIKVLENKPIILENISMYLMSRPGLSKITSQELYSAYQVVFNHSPIKNKENTVRGLADIRTDEKYLKSEFISDFYNYILTEKVKNSIVYRSTLSKFQITDRGISLTEDIPSIDNIEFSKELKDYIRLQRDSSMKYLVDNVESILSEDLLYLNFPEKATKFEGQMVIDGNFIITNTTVDNYIQVNGELYRKEIIRDNANLFVKITTSTNNVYLTSTLDFSFDKESANNFFNEYALLNPTTVAYSSFQTTISKSRLNDDMSSELKELSTLKDKSYVFTQIEGIITVQKEGKEIGSLVYKNENGVYNNPVVSVAEVHRGKGIGTELYLQLFDKAKKNGKVVNKPTEETPQSKNIFERVGSTSIQLQTGSGVTSSDVSDASKFLTFKHITGSFRQNTLSGATILGKVVVSERDKLNKAKEIINSTTSKMEAVEEGALANRTTSFEDLVKEFQKDFKKAVDIIKSVNLNNIDLTNSVFTIEDLKRVVKQAEEQLNTDVTVEATNEYIDKRLSLKGSSEFKLKTSFQQGVATEVQTPQEIVDAVLVKLKETGLANEVYSMTSSQIEEKLVSLGVTVNIAKQVIAWHGTPNPLKNIAEVSHKNKSKYGELLSGTYFGGIEMATWFSGQIVEQSRIIKASIDETDFAIIDMQGKTPVGTEELFEDGIMSKEEYDNLLERKKSGEIKGIILENSTEEGFPEVHTQYLVFDEKVIEKLKTVEYTELETNEAPVTKVFLAMQTAGVSVTPNGFVHNGEVYLNTDSPNILNTQVHEFGHLFNSWAKANRPDIYNKGIELIKSEDGKAYIDFVKESQPNLEGEKIYEEALTQAIGDQGQMIVEENARNSFMEWLSELWNSIKQTLGITDMSTSQVQNLTLDELARAIATDLMSGREFNTEVYTISPLLDDMLINKQGKMVSVQTINQILKQKGIKKIEKDIIEEVLELEGFKGKSKIPFDDFKIEVNMRVMPLTIIESRSYAAYGSDNTGVDVGFSTTNIYNTDLDHQIKGHFSGDFKNPDALEFEVRTLNEDGTHAVVRKGVTLTPENLQDNVFHATPSLEDAHNWIENYNSSKEVNQGMFGHTRVWRKSGTKDVYVAEVQSDSYQKAKAEDMLLTAYELDPSKMIEEQVKAFEEYQQATELVGVADAGIEDSNTGRPVLENASSLSKDITELMSSIKETKKSIKSADELQKIGRERQLMEQEVLLEQYMKLAKGEQLTLPDPLPTEKKNSAKYIVPYNKIYPSTNDFQNQFSVDGVAIKGLKPLEKILNFRDTTLSFEAPLISSARLEEGVSVGEFITEIEDALKTGKSSLELDEAIEGLNEELDKVRNNREWDKITAEISILRKELKFRRAGMAKVLVELKKLDSKSLVKIGAETSYLLITGHPTSGELFYTAQEAFDYYNKELKPKFDVKPEDYAEYFYAKRAITESYKAIFDNASIRDKQFIAHRKNYSERLLREEVRRNTLKGMETLSIPTPRTLSLIEGYTSAEGEGALPYTIDGREEGNDKDLEVGDEIEYLGENYTVVVADAYDIEIAETSKVNELNAEEFVEEMITERVNDDIYEFESEIEEVTEVTGASWDSIREGMNYPIDTFSAEDIGESIASTEEDGEIYEIKVDKIRSLLDDFHGEMREEADYHLKEMFDDLWEGENGKYFYSNENVHTEHLKQPDQYEEISIENFDIESMSESEQTVLKKYQGLIEEFKKEHPDAEVTTDSKGNEWVTIDLAEVDINKPVVAFQMPGARTNPEVVKESIENTSSIFDSQLELLDLYSSKEEAQIKKDMDCG